MQKSLAERGAESAVEPSLDYSAARRLWVVLVLAAIALLAAVDRNVLSVLLAPIKASLHASDAAMGALTGAVYAFVYSAFAIPMARLADRTNRCNLIAIAVVLWSAMTAFSGIATSYAQFLFARVGVAAGEATQIPASYSLIGDYFPSTTRGRAISILTIGAVLGYSVGAFAAGVLNDWFGWRVALMAVGVPGLIVALAVKLTVPEPKRGAQDGVIHLPGAATLLRDAKRLVEIRSLPWLLLGIVFLNICFVGNLVWLPTFLMRVHHLSTTTMSAVFGLTVIVAAGANVVAGFASDWIAKRGPRWRMYYCCAMAMVSAPFYAAAFLVGPTASSTALVMVFSLVSGGLTTVTAAAVISIAPADLRASMAALSAIAGSAFGGLGAFLIGLINDHLSKGLGDQAVRYSMLVLPLALVVSAAIFLLASRAMDDDVSMATGSTN